MKIFILTDLEGPAGVNLWSQTREGDTPGNRLAKKLLTWEINAAINGIRDVAPDAEVLVWDGHGSGGIDLEEFDCDAELLLSGKGARALDQFDASFDALMFVGQHAMAGTPNAPLCHTYNSRSVEYYKINGQLIGEFGCRAALAGSLGVPTIFIAGDDKACIEARALVPNIVTVETKQGLSVEMARHLSPPRARREIRIAAAVAMRRLTEIKPFIIEPPYEQEIRFYEGCSIPAGAQQVDERTIVFRSDNLRDFA